MSFAFQRIGGRGGALGRDLLRGAAGAFFQVLFRAFASGVGRGARLGRRELDTRATRLRQADGDCLFGGPCTVLALTDMLDLLADKLPRLGAGCLALFFVFASAFECLLFRHARDGARRQPPCDLIVSSGTCGLASQLLVGGIVIGVEGQQFKEISPSFDYGPRLLCDAEGISY